MSRATLAPYLGPAAVLYLLAAAASLPGAFDLMTWATGAVALLLSTTPAVSQRHADAAGAARVGWLGLSVAVALVTTTAPGVGVLWALEAARLIAFPAVAYLLVDLALSVPEPPRATGLRRARIATAVGVVIACAVALLEAAPWRLFGLTLLLPAHASRAPEFAAAAGALVALSIRTARARAGDRPEALAENAWAQLGLIPIAAVALISLVAVRYGGIDLTRAWVHGALCLSALVLVRSHLLLIDSRYRLAVGSTARRSIAITLVVAAVCLGMIGLRAALPTEPLDLALWVSTSLLLALGAYALLTRWLRYWLAPARGALLDAIEQATQRLCDVGSLSDVGAAVLPPLRDASFASDGLVLLYAFDPAVEVSIDAAGQPRLSHALPPLALTDHVHQCPHDVLVRRPLEDALVRRAEVRPLVDALQRLDALCVIPLRNQSELEGMLVLPRGLRHASLSLEELSALDRFAALLGAFVAVISRETRAAQRLNQVIVARDQAEQRIADLGMEAARLERHERALSLSQWGDTGALPIAYSPKMRALCERLTQLAPVDVPVLLRTPPGVDVMPLVRLFHRDSGRGERALVVADCATLRPAEQRVALLGSDAPDNLRPGLLRLAQGGTLVLLDLPALSVEVQAELFQVITRKRCRPEACDVDVAVNVRLLTTSRVDVTALVEAGRFEAELCARLTPVTLNVPPLRDRRDDLQSLVLLALDQTARRLGRDTLGIEPDALAALVEHRLVGNEAELSFIIEQAATRCDGPRITLAQLKLGRVATASVAVNPLSGTFDTVEKRVLKHALVEASGNKSEAARLLGLKRTTFLDKLRRHGLDDATPPRASS